MNPILKSAANWLTETIPACFIEWILTVLIQIYNLFIQEYRLPLRKIDVESLYNIHNIRNVGTNYELPININETSYNLIDLELKETEDLLSETFPHILSKLDDDNLLVSPAIILNAGDTFSETREGSPFDIDDQKYLEGNGKTCSEVQPADEQFYGNLHYDLQPILQDHKGNINDYIFQINDDDLKEKHSHCETAKDANNAADLFENISAFHNQSQACEMLPENTDIKYFQKPSKADTEVAQHEAIKNGTYTDYNSLYISTSGNGIAEHFQENYRYDDQEKNQHQEDETLNDKILQVYHTTDTPYHTLDNECEMEKWVNVNYEAIGINDINEPFQEKCGKTVGQIRSIESEISRNNNSFLELFQVDDMKEIEEQHNFDNCKSFQESKIIETFQNGNNKKMAQNQHCSCENLQKNDCAIELFQTPDRDCESIPNQTMMLTVFHNDDLFTSNRKEATNALKMSKNGVSSENKRTNKNIMSLECSNKDAKVRNPSQKDSQPTQMVSKHEEEYFNDLNYAIINKTFHAPKKEIVQLPKCIRLHNQRSDEDLQPLINELEYLEDENQVWYHTKYDDVDYIFDNGAAELSVKDALQIQYIVSPIKYNNLNGKMSETKNLNASCDDENSMDENLLQNKLVETMDAEINSEAYMAHFTNSMGFDYSRIRIQEHEQVVEQPLYYPTESISNTYTSRNVIKSSKKIIKKINSGTKDHTQKLNSKISKLKPKTLFSKLQKVLKK